MTCIVNNLCEMKKITYEDFTIDILCCHPLSSTTELLSATVRVLHASLSFQGGRDEGHNAKIFPLQKSQKLSADNNIHLKKVITGGFFTSCVKVKSTSN